MAQLENLLPEISKLDPLELEELTYFLETQAPFRFRWRPRFFMQEYPSIVATPGICGGNARLIRTRIPVWTLERMRQLGVSDIDVLRSFPTLRATDLVQAWSYAAGNRADIEKAIQENEEE